MSETELFKQIKSLSTEEINPLTRDIDILPTEEILKLIHTEDKRAVESIEAELPNILCAIELITSAFKKNGRLIYAGAGTSGRLGILDAAECPPTFGTNPDMVRGVIAGGERAVFLAQEGAEDVEQNGETALKDLNINSKDIVCGIAASGRTPYVLGALKYAKSHGCHTIIVSTSKRDFIESLQLNCDVIISPKIGPEVIAGSTRMKSGTVQKLILNMLTTVSMIKLGKIYGNIMIDLQQTNQKLIERSKRIIMDISGCDYSVASEFLQKSEGNVKVALMMLLADIDANTAREKLNSAGGILKQALLKFSK
jgi:N-acetylmuramic acid 6-phosphate etherase